MPLSDVAVRNARGREKSYKMTDGEGLYLLVKPDGGRYWRFDYRHLKKRGTLAFGVYPAVPLSEARDKRAAARKTLGVGKDPAVEKRKERAVAHVAAVNTFRAVAEEWIEKKMVAAGRSQLTVDKIRWILEFAFQEIGDDPISGIEPPQILVLLTKLEKRRMHETARRVRSNMGRVFRYAIATGRAKRDPAADLKGALTPPVVTNHAALVDPKKVGGLLRAIDGYDGECQVAAALKLAPIVFVRPGELRLAEWTEFNWDTAEWRIPAPKMKMKLLHIVPLARQAVDILMELKPLAAKSKYVFASIRTPTRPMSENTVNAALRRLGYTKEEMTGHGFRTTASTLLNEMGWNSDWVERQLAHVEENQVRRTYNAAEYLPDRKRMMQAWADHLDELRAG